MGRMEVITLVVRRRRCSDAEQAAVLAQCDARGATIVGVARQLGMSLSLIHGGWRRRQSDMALLTSEPLQFVPYGEVASGSAAAPAVEPWGTDADQRGCSPSTQLGLSKR